MTPAEIIAKSLTDTHTDALNYDPQTLGLDALNIVSDFINNEVATQVKEDYFWDEFKVDSVIGQTEYNISTGTTDWDGGGLVSVNIKKLNKLFIKYDSTSTYYTRAEEQNPAILDRDLDYYANEQATNNPFFYVQDRSLFVYPAPEAALTDGLKLNAIFTPPAITYTSDETWLPLQPDKHYIYSLGIEEQIYKAQRKTNEANNARAIFDQELEKYLIFLKSRINQSVNKTKVDLCSYR